MKTMEEIKTEKHKKRILKRNGGGGGGVDVWGAHSGCSGTKEGNQGRGIAIYRKQKSG